MPRLAIYLLILPLVCLFACSDEADSSGTGAEEQDTRSFRDVTSDGGGEDSVSTEVGANPDAEVDDAAGDGSTAQDRGGQTSDTGGSADAGEADDAIQQSDASPTPGPDNLTIECTLHEECPGDGELEGICCTTAGMYLSTCGLFDQERYCTGGQRDACLTDAQCQARRADRPFCCHDRGSRNYCAPVRETCEPLIPCDAPSDCSASPSQPCCVPHEYYGTGYCTSAFFSTNESQCL